MRSANVVAIVLSLLAFSAAGWVVWAQVNTRQQATTLADQVAAACAKGGAGAADLGAACQKAAEVKDSPVPTPAVDTGALRQAARAAVLDYCGQPSNPCRGADGRSPDIEAIVDLVVARVPAPRNGTDGKDAQPPSDQQVYGQVVAYCSQASEPCRGATGAAGQTPPCMAEAAQCRGADGRGVVSHQYLLVDGQCVERTYYTADPSPVDVPVGAALCEPPTTEPTQPTEPPETPGG